MSFHLVDSTISATGMTATQKWVLTCMSSFASEDGVCWPSVRTLSAMTGHKPDVVRGAIKDLIADGFLKKREQYRGDGGQSSNRYLINGDKLTQMRHKNRSNTGWLFDDEDVADPLPPKRGTPSPRKGGPPPPEKGDPLPPKRGTVEPIKEPIKEPVTLVAKATREQKPAFAQGSVNSRIGELKELYPLFGLLPFEYQTRLLKSPYVRGADVLELAAEAYHMSDWTPRKELPQDPFNNFNLEQEWHHLHNYIPWEFGFPAREKLCWTDPCLTVGEVNLLRSLPFFSNHVWGEGGEPPGFAIAGPYKNPYKQEPRKPSSDPTPKDTPETSRAHQKTSNPGKLVTVTDSEAVPRHMVDAFLRKNSALFSQLATKPTPTATELKLNKLLLQIRHRTFLMSYNWKEGWLEGAMDPWGPIPGDTGEGHCMPWELVFKLIQDSVDALQVARNSGLSYPKRDFKGNVQKLTLPNYLLNQSPSGTTAPWIGFLVGNRREDPEAKIGRIQSGMGKETVKVAIAIQVNTPRKSEWSMEKLATYWEGVADLVQWRKTNHDLLMGECDTHGGNKQWLSSSQSMLKLIHDFVAGDSRCGWLRWEFFGPHKPEWDSLCKWARENYNANFDLNSKVPSWKRPARAVESNHE